MRIAVTDDSPVDRKLITRRVEKYLIDAGIEYSIDEFSSAENLLESFKGGMYDIVFLDIYMNGMTGMDAAKIIFRDDPECRLIFLTSSEEYLRESYSVRAVYYLVKPIDDREFRLAMEFCGIKQEQRVKTLTLNLGGTEKTIDTSRIFYADVSGHTTQFHSKEQTISVYGSFSKVTEPLMEDSRFLVCGRGILVNLENVSDISEDCFIMKNGTEVPISMRIKRDIAAAWEEYKFKKLGDAIWK